MHPSSSVMVRYHVWYILFKEAGHISHTSIPFLKAVKNVGGHVVVLPPHTTHRLQREDMALFQTFKTVFAHSKETEAVKSFRATGKGLTHGRDWPIIAAKAWATATTEENNLRGWRVSGVHPFTVLPLWQARSLEAERRTQTDRLYGNGEEQGTNTLTHACRRVCG
jgi:hypothetical protein